MHHNDCAAAAPPVATAGLLLETSLGSFVIDIFGADCPALSANFLNLCRAEFWNGAVATEVIAEVAVFFSLTADPVYYHLLRHTLEQHHHRAPSISGGAGSLVQSFWALLPRQTSDPTASSSDDVHHTLSSTSTLPASTFSAPIDPVEQQERALAQAIQQEVRLCKRRRCVGLSLSHTGDSRGGESGRGAVYEPVFTAVSSGGAASPCAVSGAGRLIVDITGPTLRFGLTLSDRTMDFLEKQYVVIGHVREGEAVLRQMQRLPLKSRPASGTTSLLPPAQSGVSLAALATSPEDVVAGRPASTWPHPVRMLRVKRALVLPTAGTEKFISTAPAAWSGISSSVHDVDSGAEVARLQRQRVAVGQALHQAGCFAYWASSTAVRAAHRQLVDVVRACLERECYTVCTRPNTVAEATALLQHSSNEVTPSSSNNSGDPAGSISSLAPPSAQKPFIILQRSCSTPSHSSQDSNDDADVLQLTYNPHFTGAYLSSEDDDGVYDADNTPNGVNASSHALRLSAKQLEERRKHFMEQHREKANETLSLMLNLLNGVADTRGDMKPPENVLFVCKLNPVTTGEGLASCFAQFGRVVSADVVQDAKTKRSLCYGFVEFATVEACFRAFKKMDGALIDDCRIHVDFSQSVSKLWAQRQREMRKRDRPV